MQSAVAKLLFAGRIAVAVLLLSLSTFALVNFNWQYFETGGGFIDKFHPATLLAFGLIAMTILSSRNPFTAAVSLADRHLSLLPFVLATIFVIAYTGRLLGHSITIFIETFLGAVAMFILFEDLDERSGRILARIIHALLFVNALLAFYEVFSGFRLTPLVIDGEVLADEPRATALLGHPLSNALIAGAYVVILALGGGRDLPAALRPAVFIVALASLVPFGGRAATGTCLFTLLVLAVVAIGRILRGGRFNSATLLWAMLAIPVSILVLVIASELGALDTLTQRLVEDEGSAGTRIVMFELFRHFSFQELFFGPDPEVLMTLVRVYGLEYGLESFIVAFILHYGLISTIVFMPFLFTFLYQIVRATRPSSGYVIFYFVVVALASVSLSSKSPILSMFVVLVMTLMRPAHMPDERAEDG